MQYDFSINYCKLLGNVFFKKSRIILKTRIFLRDLSWEKFWFQLKNLVSKFVLASTFAIYWYVKIENLVAFPLKRREKCSKLTQIVPKISQVLIIKSREKWFFRKVIKKFYWKGSIEHSYTKHRNAHVKKASKKSADFNKGYCELNA